MARQPKCSSLKLTMLGYYGWWPKKREKRITKIESPLVWESTKKISEMVKAAELGPLNALNDRGHCRLMELQELARTKNIDVVKTTRRREKKGLQGQSKGTLQVLWERSWIDKVNLEKYTIEPATNAKSEVLKGAEEWSLQVLMASCLDFSEENTALHNVGNELGVLVIILPKFHEEQVRRQRIEYSSWNMTNGLYCCKKPLQSKRSKKAFRALVMECTSRDILQTETVWKLLRWARAYICAYCMRACKTTPMTRQYFHLALIERLVKAFKTHRVAINFDVGFVNGCVSKHEKGVFCENARCVLQQEWEYGLVERIECVWDPFWGFN